jgi:hypothetical protein
VQLANEEMPEIITADEGNGDTAIGMANEQYQKFISWEGSPLRNDFYAVDMQSGKSEKKY